MHIVNYVIYYETDEVIKYMSIIFIKKNYYTFILNFLYEKLKGLSNIIYKTK